MAAEGKMGRWEHREDEMAVVFSAFAKVLVVVIPNYYSTLWVSSEITISFVVFLKGYKMHGLPHSLHFFHTMDLDSKSQALELLLYLAVI